MSKFNESGDHGIRHDDSPEELARKLYDDPAYFEANPRGYRDMANVARASDWHDGVVRDFVQVLPVQWKVVLDVGCATGAYMRPLHEAGAQVHGIELSKYAADVAAQVMGERVHNGSARVVHGSAHDLSAFGDGSFDLYFTVETIEHVPYRYHLAMLREAFRVLKPRGVAYVQGQIGVKDYLMPHPGDDAGHIAVFPEGYWRDMLRHVGFALDDVDAQLAQLNQKLGARPWWRRYGWRYLFARKP